MKRRFDTKTPVAIGRMLLLISLLAVSVLSQGDGMPLSAYREKVQELIAVSDRLAELNREAESTDPLSEEEFRLQNSILAGAYAATVNADDGSIVFAADNSWLEALVARLESSDGDRAQRDEALREIAVRLTSIEKELSAIGTAEARLSGDEYKRKVGEILARPQFQKDPSTDESFLDRILNNTLEFIRSLFPRSPRIDPTDGASRLNPSVIKAVLALLVLAALVFIGAKLRKKFGLGRRRAGTGDRVILGELVEKHIVAEDLFRQSETLAGEGDFKGAIRKGYIAFICGLGDRGLVRLSDSKTNHDYLRELRKHEPLLEDAKIMTDIFEEHWYGFSPTGDEDWRLFRDRYREAEAKEGRR